MPTLIPIRQLTRHALILAAVLLCGVGVYAQAPATADAAEYSAQTTDDPKIPIDELKLMLMPLTLEELRVEAAAWVEQVKAKAHAIADAEIAARYKSKEIKETTAAAKAAKEAKASVESGDSSEDTAEKIGKAAEGLEQVKASEERAEKNQKAAAAQDEALKMAEEEAKAEADGTDEDPSVEATPKPGSDKIDADLPTAQSDAAPAVEEVTESLAKAADAAEKAVEAKSDVRADLLEAINKLRDERAMLVDRTNIVLVELTRKGGEPDEYKKYIAAVSEVRLDVSDSAAAWATVVGWFKSEEGGLRWARNFLWFIATLIVFWVISTIAGRTVERIMRRTRNVTNLMRDFISTAVRRTLLAVGLVVGLSAMEVDVAPLLALIGAAGFVVAFALQDTLGNFASGIMILVYRPFDVGDVVDIADVSGKVASLNLVSVKVCTFDNKIVLIPNNTVWGNVIVNATGSRERRVDMVFGIGYDDDMQQAQEILERVVSSHALVLKNPEPVIKVNELADSSVNFVCRPWVKTADYWTVYWDITRAVKEAFDAEGVSIPYPQRDVHLVASSVEVETEEETEA